MKQEIKILILYFEYSQNLILYFNPKVLILIFLVKQMIKKSIKHGF